MPALPGPPWPDSEIVQKKSDTLVARLSCLHENIFCWQKHKDFAICGTVAQVFVGRQAPVSLLRKHSEPLVGGKFHITFTLDKFFVDCLENRVKSLWRKGAMKKGILLIAVILLSATGTSEAREDKLGVTFDLTYRSKWLSKGVEAYGQQGALFETIDLDLYGTGFGVKVTHRNATGGGYVDNQRFDYRPYYKSQLFEERPYATNYNISVGYEHYPGLARNVANTTFEWIYAFSWPNIMPKGFVPSYIAHYEYPAGSNYRHHNITGWAHRFMLGYDLNLSTIPEPLHLSSELAYTDGLGGAVHDWSYATFGVSSGFKVTDNLTFVPGVYHQLSMDDSVCEHDVTYCILSMKYKF